MIRKFPWWRQRKPVEPTPAPTPDPVECPVVNPRLDELHTEIKRQIDEANARVDAMLERLRQKESAS